MLLLRDVQKADLEALGRLARVLDTVNLPANARSLSQLVDHSTRSFSARIRDPEQRLYLFVLEDTATKQIIGTSQIIARHGTREAPHVYLDLFEREHYSAGLDRHFKHQVMQIGYNYEGFTEIGGLVVHPEFRGQDKPGKQLSFIRFLYLAMHPSRFCNRVLAELLPPLLPDGRSVLWESFGARFTGLTYQEADKLSRESKEFIKELFPAGEIYLELLPENVRSVVGRVGPQTEGVRKMLEAIGFAYDMRIDPFDGGPHYSAPVSQVSLVREYHRPRLQHEPLTGSAIERLVAIERPKSRQKLRAVKSPCRLEGDRIWLPAETMRALKVDPGERIHTIPFA